MYLKTSASLVSIEYMTCGFKMHFNKYVLIYVKPLRFLLWPMLTQSLNFQRSGLEVGSSLGTRLKAWSISQNENLWKHT